MRYGAKVVFKSVKTGYYLSVNQQEGSVRATGHHPILYVKDLEVNMYEELTLLKFEDRESRDFVTFNSSICLQTPDGYFLAFSANNDLLVEKNSKFEDV